VPGSVQSPLRGFRAPAQAEGPPKSQCFVGLKPQAFTKNHGHEFRKRWMLPAKYLICRD